MHFSENLAAKFKVQRLINRIKQILRLGFVSVLSSKENTGVGFCAGVLLGEHASRPSIINVSASHISRGWDLVVILQVGSGRCGDHQDFLRVDRRVVVGLEIQLEVVVY